MELNSQYSATNSAPVQEPETQPGQLRKLEAMQVFVDRWSKRISSDKDPELAKLLEKFRIFVSDYIQLLRSVPLSVANPRVITAVGLKQLYDEWGVLSRAASQRLESDNDADFSDKLCTAQLILKTYLDRWRGSDAHYLAPKSKNDHQRGVIYFDKSYSITRSIYAPEIPIISIPLTDYSLSTNWQAIAHEVGHHFFWNALDLETMDSVQQRMQDIAAEALAHLLPKQRKFTGEAMSGLEQSWKRMTTWQKWTEEVFADMVGTLLAGPAFVISSQNLAAEQVGARSDFATDDGEHPCPYLRPIICLQTLRQMTLLSKSQEFQNLMNDNGNGNDNGIIHQLEARWDRFCGSDVGEEIHHYSGVRLTDLVKDVDFEVEELLKAPIWTAKKKLQDLFVCFGQNSADINEKEHQAIQTMLKVPLPAWASIQEQRRKNSQQPITIPDSLKPLWDYIAAKSEKIGLTPVSTPPAMPPWDQLLSIGLSHGHSHETAHAFCTRHWFFGARHFHDSDTGVVISC